jgi:hypothetical protein
MLVVLFQHAPQAADLEDRTSRAYEDYVKGAQRDFLARAQAAVIPAAPAQGGIQARPAREDGIISVPGGLVHHWTGSMVVPKANLRTVVALSRAYSSYGSIYHEIIASKLIDRVGDTDRTLMRLQEGEAGITAVLEIKSTVQYHFPTERSAFSVSSADEIREVKGVGGSDERLLPAGHDSGYLWRANVFSQFIEFDKGVYMEVETVGLSRGYPPLLGWIIEPIAQRLGRRSVVQSLEEFAAALRRAQ